MATALDSNDPHTHTTKEGEEGTATQAHARPIHLWGTTRKHPQQQHATITTTVGATVVVITSAPASAPVTPPRLTATPKNGTSNLCGCGWTHYLPTSNGGRLRLVANQQAQGVTTGEQYSSLLQLIHTHKGVTRGNWGSEWFWGSCWVTNSVSSIRGDMRDEKSLRGTRASMLLLLWSTTSKLQEAELLRVQGESLHYRRRSSPSGEQELYSSYSSHHNSSPAGPQHVPKPIRRPDPIWLGSYRETSSKRASTTSKPRSLIPSQ